MTPAPQSKQPKATLRNHYPRGAPPRPKPPSIHVLRLCPPPCNHFGSNRSTAGSTGFHVFSRGCAC
eukprot:4536924-Pyramimonas_sp.AAC.1